MADLYLIALRVLIGINHKLNIVVVGANDGKINDPIYGFGMRMSSRTNILLIEPNAALLPYLKENYSLHPSHQIANCAIGEEGELTLYAIKEDSWERFQPAYAKGWPLYRAPTGITSANRAYLEDALVRENLNPDDVIEILDVPSKELKTLLAELNWPSPIDVLQIDAEGYDDSVIYASSLQFTRPKLIFFENDHIPPVRMETLLKHLSGHRYRTYEMGRSSLSIDSRINPLCISLNGAILIVRIVRKFTKVLNAIFGRGKGKSKFFT